MFRAENGYNPIAPSWWRSGVPHQRQSLLFTLAEKILLKIGNTVVNSEVKPISYITRQINQQRRQKTKLMKEYVEVLIWICLFMYCTVSFLDACITCHPLSLRSTVAQFTDPWLGDKVNSGIGLSYRPSSHVAWHADTTSLCWSWLLQSGTSQGSLLKDQSTWIWGQSPWLGGMKPALT